jgi:hypothetical protein
MEVTLDLINGLSFGIEYVSAAPEADVPNPCIIIDFACFRWIIELTGASAY